MMQMDEKGYSDDDDDGTGDFQNTKSNNFMHEVHRQRKQSFSYSKQDDSDSDTPQHHMDYNDSLGMDTEQKYNNNNFNSSSPLLSQNIIMQSLKRTNTDNLLHSKSSKLTRRHSADKILIKPTTKNTNSTDYLNRQIIALRSKITTYREDLRISGELGQNLWKKNQAKDTQIEQFKNDIRKLQHQNEELHISKQQLLQTSQLDAEHTKRLETDLNRQMDSHTTQQSKYEEENIRLREELEHYKSDIRNLTQLTESQREEIQLADTRNEQISQNAQETIEDLSQELAEEKDGHSNLKHKYSKLRQQYTTMKINYEKRGTEINNLKNQVREQDLKILAYQAENENKGKKIKEDEHGANQQKIKLLYRQLENTKEEMEGISQHLDYSKQYLKHTMDYLEKTGLLMEQPLSQENNLNVDEIYNLCKNARQFLGIDIQKNPPPDPVYPEESPEAPAPELPPDEPTEPLPNDNEPLTPSIPRERTPELKVSQREVVPMSVPAPPKQPTPPPSKPIQPLTPTSPPSLPKQQKPKKPKIRSKPSLPPSIPSVPEQPPQEPPQQRQQIPLPRPKTPKQKPKTYNLGMMPQAILSPGPSLPAPATPSNRDIILNAPSLPTEVRSKPKSFSSAMKPPKPKASSPFFPPPNAPQQPLIPTTPTTPTTPTKPVKINAQAAMPPDIAPPQPRTPSYSEPRLPSPRQPIPQSQTHNLGVMPASVVDEKQSISFDPPSIPRQYDQVNILPSIPQEPKPKVSVSAAAMAPPSIPSPKIITPPPMPSQPSTTDFVPAPKKQEKPLMESLKSGVQNNNEFKAKPKKKKSMAKKKKKSKKVKKERDTMEEQKRHLTVFFTTYSDSKNWEEGAKENGVQRYVLKFAEREPLNARMAFLYSMTLYLGQIVGVNKRCISHAFMLFKSVRAQIDTLSEEFALILQTLEHHNDDKLWKYVYSFLYNAAAYFKHIQRFVGTRTSVANPKKYSRDLKSHSRDYTNHTNRRESSFRKLSGLSEVSGQSIIDFNDQNSNISGISNKSYNTDRMVYGNPGDVNLNNNRSSNSGSRTNRKSNKKKK